MRWLLLFLIVLNGVVLFWFGQQQKTEDRKESNGIAASTAGVPGIVLLAEVPRSKIKYKKAESEPKEEEPPVLTEAPVPESPGSSKAESVAQSPQSASANDLVEAAGPVVAIAKPAEVKPISKGACGFLGPFAEPITVRQIAGRLKRAQIENRIYSESTAINPVYWVYLKPAASRSAALATLRALQAARIESFIVGEGEDANAISLGFFKKKESAESIRQQRVAQGFDAVLVKKERRRDQYWTVIQPRDWIKVDAPLLTELRAEYGEFTRRSRKCSFVASLTQFE